MLETFHVTALVYFVLSSLPGTLLGLLHKSQCSWEVIQTTSSPPAKAESDEILPHDVRDLYSLVVAFYQRDFGFVLPEAADVLISYTEADSIDEAQGKGDLGLTC